jgi:histone H1/5
VRIGFRGFLATLWDHGFLLDKSPGHLVEPYSLTGSLQLKDRNGSSRQSLKKFVKANNNLGTVSDNMFDSLFNKALKNGVEKGVFAQPKGPSGGTKLAKKKAEPKKPAAKKEGAAKKETTKKAAAPKSAEKKTTTTKKAAAPKAAAEKKTTTATKKAAPKKAATTGAATAKKASAAKVRLFDLWQMLHVI